MPLHFFWKSLGFLVLTALLLAGCGGTGPGLGPGVQDESCDTWAPISPPKMVSGNSEDNEYFGYSSPDPDRWNPTDWQRWVELNGGG
jgi:hypothetical protein